MGSRVKETIAWCSLLQQSHQHLCAPGGYAPSLMFFLQLHYANRPTTQQCPRDTCLEEAGEHLQLTSLQSTSVAEPLPRARHHLLLEIPFANY